MTELEERLAKVESVLAQQEDGDRWEKKTFEIEKKVLFLIAASAPVVWALFELISMIIDRVGSLVQSLQR